MATHDFSSSLSYEQSQFPVQDKFYTEKLGAKVITRADFDDEEGRALQRMDVDVQFEYNGKLINVSEKHRTRDYGDLLLEFYSMFPDIPGWMNNSNADYLAYFVPEKVYWINKRELEDFYENVLKPVVTKDFFEQLVKDHPETSTRVKQKIKVNGRQETVTVVQAYNQPCGSNKEWYTENICVSFDLLKRAGVSIQVFNL